MLRHFIRVQLFATLWAVAHQASLSMGFLRQEYWSGLPCPPPGDLPCPGIQTQVSHIARHSLLSEPPGKPFYKVTGPKFSAIYPLELGTQ